MIELAYYTLGELSFTLEEKKSLLASGDHEVKEKYLKLCVEFATEAQNIGITSSLPTEETALPEYIESVAQAVKSQEGGRFNSFYDTAYYMARYRAPVRETADTALISSLVALETLPNLVQSIQFENIGCTLIRKALSASPSVWTEALSIQAPIEKDDLKSNLEDAGLVRLLLLISGDRDFCHKIVKKIDLQDRSPRKDILRNTWAPLLTELQEKLKLIVFNPKILLMADKPIRLGGIPLPVKIHEIEAELKFKYSEAINLGAMPPDRLQPSHGEDFIYRQILDRMQHPLTDKLSICFISEKVGYGVFATELIEAGTIIGLYAGQVEKMSEETKDYGMQFGGDFTVEGDEGQEKIDIRIDAGETGGITRFIQHMPYSLKPIIRAIEDEMKKIIEKRTNRDFLGVVTSVDKIFSILHGNGIFFDDVQITELKTWAHSSPLIEFQQFIKNQYEALRELTQIECTELIKYPFLDGLEIATANISRLSLKREGKPIIYFQANSDILPEEQLGISYGLDYWFARRILPEYFDKNGQVIAGKTIVDQMLKKYTRPDGSIPDREFGLRLAASEGNEDDVLLLLTRRALINAQGTQSKKTALHFAYEKGHKNIQELLMISGADQTIIDTHGKKPSDYDQITTLRQGM